MSIRTSEVRSLERMRAWTAGLALGFLAVSGAACDDDVGRCCDVIDPALAGRIPTATVTPMGLPTSDIAIDPAFECESLTCVAYQGSRAYCTARCFEDADCPEAFDCAPVLESDPGPGSDIRPTDRFCVRSDFVCRE